MCLYVVQENRNHGLFGDVFLGTTRFLSFRLEEKIDLSFSSRSGRTSCETGNLKMLSVPGMICASSISLGTLRITSDFSNNMVIEGQNWFEVSQKSSAE